MTGEQTLTRRRLLRNTLLPLAVLPLLQRCGKTRSIPCSDPSLLSRGEEQMRKTREYVDISSLADQHCSNCQFFNSSEGNECGHCEILDGDVNASGYCTSWAGRG